MENGNAKSYQWVRILDMNERFRSDSVRY